MVSTTEGFTNNTPSSPSKQPTLKKPSAIKPLCLFTTILYAKNKILPVKLELLNQSARKLNMEIHRGH